MDNPSVIREYLRNFDIPGFQGVQMRHKIAAEALEQELAGQRAFLAADGDGRAVLVSVVGGVLRLTTFCDVGDNENKLDELETVWLDRLVGANLRCRQRADRNVQPVLAISLHHDRLPGSSLDFSVRHLSSEAVSELFESLAGIVGRGVASASEPMVAFV